MTTTQTYSDYSVTRYSDGCAEYISKNDEHCRAAYNPLPGGLVQVLLMTEHTEDDGYTWWQDQPVECQPAQGRALCRGWVGGK